MVVTTNRCPTPTLIDGSMAGSSERSPTAIKKALHSVSNEGGEPANDDDSDTGCSSLDDDDSFDGELHLLIIILRNVLRA